MKKDYKIFFAIPFNPAIKKLYKDISKRIINKYPCITTVIGNQEISPSKRYSDIASFKRQNVELNKQFINTIREADIIIADLTHNNPNVHVEIGIALSENKNILRVTGRQLTELGFDIRNLEIFRYSDFESLFSTISDYLKIFFEIKKIPISNVIPQLYQDETALPIKLQAKMNQFKLKQVFSPDFMIRDAAIEVEFDIIDVRKDEDWFGVYFRSGIPPTQRSNLVYVRKNGILEVAVYPGPRVIERYDLGKNITGRNILKMEFDNNYLEISLGSNVYKTNKIYFQEMGLIFLAAWYADVDVYSARMICRDTIELNSNKE